LTNAFVDDLSPKNPVRFNEKETKAALSAAKMLLVIPFDPIDCFDNKPTKAKK